MKLPEGLRAHVLVAAGLALVLAACAGPRERDATDDRAAAEQIRLLRDIAELLPGRYSNHLQWREDNAERQYNLEIELTPVDVPDRLVLHLTQSGGDDPPRRFRLVVSPGRMPGNLAGELQPLGGDGQARGRCPMNFTGTDVGFTGETDPHTCSFGSGESRVGLLKEIAFDGSQVIIADKIVETGEPGDGQPDQVLCFHRMRTFSGWAGVRPDGDGEWRIAGDVSLVSEGGRAEPADRNGVALGIRIELARVRWREDQPPILRLAVYENADELIGYAWADPGAVEIGLSLETVQVGLRAE